MFDPNTFMEQNVDKPMAETFRKVPAGEYQAMVDDFSADKVFTHKEGISKKGEPYSFDQWSVPFIIQDGKLQSELERGKIVVYMKGFLDLDSNGGLSTAPDKNVKLGQLRAAVGQNTGVWNFGMLRGAGPIMIRVIHRPNEDDPENPYVEVSRVSAIR